MEEDEIDNTPWNWINDLVDMVWGALAALGLISVCAIIGLYSAGFFDWVMKRAGQ